MENEVLFWSSNAVFAAWCIAFGIGMFLFLLGLYVFFFKRNYKLRFETSVASEFAAYWILNIPIEFCNEFDGNNAVLHLIYSSLISLLKTFTTFLGNGYERVNYVGRPVFSMIYGGLLTIVNLFILLFMAGLIIKFIDGPVQRFKLLGNRNKNLIIFSEYNERTLSIASSLPEGKGSMVFVSSRDPLSDEQKHKISELGGTILYDSLATTIKKYQKYAFHMEVFVFNDEEWENLVDIADLSENMKGVSTPTYLYVELSGTPWDMYNVFLSGNDCSNVTVNFVRVEETYVYNDLLHHSIFSNYTENSSGDKVIKILIAGINERNIEMLKAVLHLSQMPGYRPEILVIDEEDRPGLLRKILPDVKNECDIVGDAIYKLDYYGGIHFDSVEFEELIENKAKDFNFAFINISDDLTNVNTGLWLNSICKRNNRDSGFKIQVNVHDSSVCEQWNKELIADLQITGEDSKVYSYPFITMSDIERISKGVHDVRQEEKLQKAKQKALDKGVECKYRKTSWEEYCNSEYNRHSVYARTLSFRYKVRMITEAGLDPSVTSQIDPWLIYEHMRWNMYTRTLGYVCPRGDLMDKIKELNKKIEESTDSEVLKALKKERQQLRSKARVHEDLVGFDELSPEVQSYDGLKLTPEIVREFESSNIED